jgi:acyl-homoserine-lactone acylase
VSGAKSSTGKPILLIDPHWPIEGHLQLCEAHVHAGPWQCWGFMITGTPLVGLGATPGVAWTFTAGGADSSDAYALRLDPKDPDRYEMDGQFVSMERRAEKFLIKEKEQVREVTETFRATRHGPVLTNKKGERFAAAVPGWSDAQAMEQFWRMNLARTAREFRAAIALDRLSYFNLMWASAEGHIGYVQLGEVPLRPPEYDWEKRVPGWTSATLYRGRVPFDRLPQVEDPPAHFLQNCNTAANVVTPGLKFTKADFPPGGLYGHHGAYRARGQRATALLGQAKKLDLDAARRIVFDTYCPPADLWVPILLAAVKEARDPPELREAAGLLQEWDRRVEADSTGATVFRFWRLACDRMANAKAGRDAFRIDDTPPLRRECLEALREAVKDLQKRYGRVAVPWGEIKRLRRGGREWPLSGDGLGRLGLDTLRATAAADLDSQHKLVIGGGQSNIGLVFLGEEPVIHAVVAYGQSNRPGSRHFADQAPLYASHKLRPVPWTEKAVRMQQTEERTIRGPR